MLVIQNVLLLLWYSLFQVQGDWADPKNLIICNYLKDILKREYPV